MRRPLALAGGSADPNLQSLAAACGRQGTPIVDLRVPADASPAFSWDVDAGAVVVDGEPLAPAGIFVRYDVFGGQAHATRPGARELAWFQAIHGWALADARMRVFNRGMSDVASNKPACLAAARAAGLVVPRTMVTNVRADIGRHDIVKPIAGGDYCQSIGDVIDRTEFRGNAAALPAIVQKRLVSPEIRLFVVGRFAFAFEIASASLDYRVHQDAQVTQAARIPIELAPLRALMAGLHMDFGAADFKTDPESGALTFLELNTSPMFAHFDVVAEGRLCDAMVSELTGGD